MTTRKATAHPRRPRAAGVAACLAALALGALVVGAAAQQTEPAPAPVPPGQGASPPPASAPPAANRPGFLHTLGDWFGRSFGSIDSGLKSARETITSIGGKAGQAAKGAASTAKDTAGTIARLPGTRMVDGREKCALAPNGAPDCYAAASALCRGKGFSDGKSVAIQSAQKCPTRVWLSGRPPQEGDCATETYVIRAVCN